MLTTIPEAIFLDNRNNPVTRRLPAREGCQLECYCPGFYALRELRLPKAIILSDRTLLPGL